MKRTFKHITGEIINGTECCTWYHSLRFGLVHKDLIELSSEWEEVIEDKKEYEILSFKSPYGSLPVETRISGSGIFLKDLKYSILSIKRLSDNQIFTIGNIFNDGDAKNITISKFSISEENGLIVNVSLLKNIEMCFKKRLFCTEDNIDIYTGDTYYTADYKKFITNTFTHTAGTGENQKQAKVNNILWFSSKEAAEEWILLNKPCLSYIDIVKMCDTAKSGWIILGQLKELVKTKLKTN